MEALKVGIIGCGRPLSSEGSTGYGMSHWHARGYAAADCRLTALADVNLENAHAFQLEHGAERVYQDYREMLAEENLDIVSVCTWPPLHPEMVVAAANASVRAIHCEKPIAPTYAESLQMVEACRRSGVQLTFNHQRRFASVFRSAKALLDAGEIGKLVRLEGTCSNLFDWGTHWFDMFCYYNDEQPVEWVLGQADWRDGPTHFGVPMEGQGLSYFRFHNGVYGLLVTGLGSTWEASNRLVGEDGVIEVGCADGTGLRLQNSAQTGWRVIEARSDLGGVKITQDGVIDLVKALRSGREPELSAARAIRATELIFATYQSSRRGGRIDLPLHPESDA